MLVLCKVLDHLDNAVPQLGLLYSSKRSHQCDTIRRSEKASYILGYLNAAVGLVIWCSFEKERYWDFENSRYLLQSARADPIGALLLFLDLLERNA